MFYFSIPWGQLHLNIELIQIPIMILMISVLVKLWWGSQLTHSVNSLYTTLRGGSAPDNSYLVGFYVLIESPSTDPSEKNKVKLTQLWAAVFTTFTTFFTFTAAKHQDSFHILINLPALASRLPCNLFCMLTLGEKKMICVRLSQPWAATFTAAKLLVVVLRVKPRVGLKNVAVQCQAWRKPLHHLDRIATSIEKPTTALIVMYIGQLQWGSQMTV